MYVKLKGGKQFKGVTADQKIILSDGGELNRENIPLHCLGFLARLDHDILNKKEVLENEVLGSSI